LKTSRGRSTQKQIIIFGQRETRRAADTRVPLTELFVSRETVEPATLSELESIATRTNSKLIGLPNDLFRKLSYGDRQVAVIAVANRPTTLLDDIPNPPLGLHVVLESVEKPGNIGAVVRTADAVGATSVIVADPVSDLFHPNAIRASMGCVFSLSVGIATSEQVVRWLDKNKIKTFATRVDALSRYDQADFRESSAVVFGSEAHGLSDIWRTRKIEKIRLPLLGTTDSLNVSTTAAVVLYEAMRQRGFNS
jgi:TrmH family RNA methyltransferase